MKIVTRKTRHVINMICETFRYWQNIVKKKNLSDPSVHKTAIALLGYAMDLQEFPWEF